MINIEIIGRDKIAIPEGYYEIEPENLVKAEDQICMVAIEVLKVHPIFKITWLKPDASEIGQVKAFSGQIVIRPLLSLNSDSKS